MFEKKINEHFGTNVYFSLHEAVVYVTDAQPLRRVRLYNQDVNQIQSRPSWCSRWRRRTLCRVTVVFSSSAGFVPGSNGPAVQGDGHRERAAAV